ncbi:MAG: hypothetical protein M1832_001446 [Thelocarpon impressellum]|nr:MAG: hypothetical protein M1832_001446 [Thelocarpon impressellum]
MMRVQRRFGKLLPRTADESQVSVLLKDYDDADTLLAKIIDSSKAWRDAWVAILGHQTKLVGEFHAIYLPIIGASETGEAPDYAETPDSTLRRTMTLKEVYDELRTDLLEEIGIMDARIVKPAMDAKDSIQPMKKVIKKREDKKLDYERYQGRVDVMMKKTKRSERDNASLAKAERELERATQEYHDADDHLKSALPPVITASFSILPHLLSSQILIQNTVLAQYYTALHTYCEEEGFPSPAPPMEDVIGAWDLEFRPTHQVIEGINSIASGKAVKQPLKFEDQSGSTVTGLNIRNGIKDRRTPSHAGRRPAGTPATHALPAAPSDSRLAITAPPSLSSSTTRTHSPSSTALTSRTSSPGALGPPSEEARSGTGVAHSPAAPRMDYFSRDRVASSSSVPTQAAIAAKKKPPPRPPPKKKPSEYGVWVTALYSFDGQGEGDLAFREGDKIRVLKKTESTDDWWEGELRGQRGAFPANYCQLV